ncbi:MAG: hypothetical protein ACODAC_10655 [Pseudomonadota bacterium]
MLLGPVVLAGWAWFGWIGAVPLIVWWWRMRPGVAVPCWEIDLVGVHRARLGPWRICITFVGRSRVEIFADELGAGDAARLRRNLAHRLSMRGRPEHVEPV